MYTAMRGYTIQNKTKANTQMYNCTDLLRVHGYANTDCRLDKVEQIQFFIFLLLSRA